MRRMGWFAAVLALSLAAAPAHGQSILQRAKQKAKDAADKAVEKATEKPAAPATPVTKDDAPDGDAGPPGQGAWLNYDFVPGARTVFVEDFEGNEVGDFPRRFRLEDGNLEVVRVGGKPMLRSQNGGSFYVKLPERLPPRFTVEVTYHSGNLGNPLKIATTRETFERSATFGCYANQAFVDGNGVGPNSGSAFQTDAPAGFVTCRFTIDNGRGIKAYVDEHRTANAPQDSVALTDTLFFQIPAYGAAENDPTLLAGLRVAAGGKKLYDALSTAGRVATQGILFDTGSDRLRPESTPTLEEIGGMLRDHADLKLLIEGHTDDVGAAAANQTLSEKRAAAVRQYLVDRMKIDAARLTAKGFGSTKPVAPNTTPEGRQNNRRVELVKQ